MRRYAHHMLTVFFSVAFLCVGFHVPANAAGISSALEGAAKAGKAVATTSEQALTGSTKIFQTLSKTENHGLQTLITAIAVNGRRSANDLVAGLKHIKAVESEDAVKQLLTDFGPFYKKVVTEMPNLKGEVDNMLALIATDNADTAKGAALELRRLMNKTLTDVVEISPRVPGGEDTRLFRDLLVSDPVKGLMYEEIKHCTKASNKTMANRLRKQMASHARRLSLQPTAVKKRAVRFVFRLSSSQTPADAEQWVDAARRAWARTTEIEGETYTSLYTWAKQNIDWVPEQF